MTDIPNSTSRRLESALRSAVSGDWSAVYSGARNVLRRGRGRVATGQVRVVDAVLGPRRANSYFWHAPAKDLSLHHVQTRIEFLADKHPAELVQFVVQTIERTNDPVVVVALARHPYSREVLTEWLAAHATGGSKALVERLVENRLLGGAFAGVARLLLEREAAEALFAWVSDVYQLPDSRMFQFVDSIGWRPNGQPQGPSSRNGAPATFRHRLVIAEHFADASSMALLIPGAEKVTLIATSDTFGQADFSAFEDWPGVGEVVVDHIRDRITRFSQQYIDLHETTALKARAIVDNLATMPHLLDEAVHEALVFGIADYLFFQALKIRSVEELLGDNDFDHVVLATGDHGIGSEFPVLMAGVRGLYDDPRLEIISTSRSRGVRANFWSVVEQLQRPTSRRSQTATRMSYPFVLRKFDEDAQRMADLLDDRETERQSVVLVTAHSDAYNESTAGYAHELQVDFDVRIVHIGDATSALVEYLSEIEGDGPEIPIEIVAASPGRCAPLAEHLTMHLEPYVETLSEPSSADEQATNWVIRWTLARLVGEVVAPTISRSRTLKKWFNRLEAAGTLPDAVVVTPNRNVGVIAAVAVARSVRVPTVVLEPHAQDSNYCRYAKVTADYYGVISDYFRLRASEGYGISRDRTFTVGSPRQVAPPNYNPDKMQQVARRWLADETGVDLPTGRTCLVYFCQPSEWCHVARVWSNILHAARENGAVVLLKPHPEESVTRVGRYLRLADECGAGDLTYLLDCDAATAIDVGDLVLTGYSTAGVDAALRQKPVVCVTDGDVRYPFDLTEIVAAQLVTSADELSKIIASYQQDPGPWKARAGELLRREPQFVTGPGPHVRALIARAIEAGPDGLRDADDLPSSFFLDGPHPTFQV